MTNTNEDLGFKTTPRYRHDGANSAFLGHHGKYDLYFSQSTRETTVIARFGEEGEYASGMPFSFGKIAPLVDARRRAQTRGLLEYPLADGAAHTPVDAPSDLRDELRAALLKSPVAPRPLGQGGHQRHQSRCLATLELGHIKGLSRYDK